MARTKIELATAALREMSVIDASETAEDYAEASTQLQTTYNDKYAELKSIGETYWVRDQIPEAVFLAVRDLLILEVSGSFGEPVSPELKDQRETIILKRIRRHKAREETGKETQAKYF